MYGIRSLEVYNELVKFRVEIRDLVRSFPTYEKSRLADQMIRASRSAPANIAEGYGRYHYQEFIQFLRIARGSVYELLDHLLCSLEEDFIDKDQYNQYSFRMESLIKLLNGWISYLKKQKSASKNNNTS